MIIYGEALFLENAAVGGALLLLTGRMLGLRSTVPQLLCGSAACGLYSFTLFLTGLSTAVSLLMKLGFSGAVLWLVYGSEQLWKKIAVFYLMTAALGGTVIALLYLLGIPGMTGGGGIYIGGSYESGWGDGLSSAPSRTAVPEIACGVVLGLVGLRLLTGTLRGRVLSGETVMTVEIRLGTEAIRLCGMVDTGNSLRDPLSGRPAFLLAAAAAQPLFHETIPDCVFCCLPFRSLGTASGLLRGFRPDEVWLERNGVRRAVRAVIGLYEGEFPAAPDGRDCQVLIHPEVLP